MFDIEIERTEASNGYFWYLLRALSRLKEAGRVNLTLVPRVVPSGAPKDVEQYVLMLWVDDQPVIVDVRDHHYLPVLHMTEFPDARVLKSSFSTELWEDPTLTEDILGMDFPAEQRDLVDRVVPFALGRSMSIPLHSNEFDLVTKAREKAGWVAGLAGAGQTWQQTHNRLRVLELIGEVMPTSCLRWFRSDRCVQAELVPDYESRSAPFAGSTHFYEMISSLTGYLSWLNSAVFGLNFPGFCLSPPFRLVDGVLADVPCISTRIWADAYKGFPCFELPVCGFLGVGDWEQAKEGLVELKGEGPDSPRARLRALEAREWYHEHLSPDGMLGQILEAVR